MRTWTALRQRGIDQSYAYAYHMSWDGGIGDEYINIYIDIITYYIYMCNIYIYYRGKRKARHKSTCHEGGQESKKNDDSTSANSKWKAEQGPKN